MKRRDKELEGLGTNPDKGEKHNTNKLLIFSIEKKKVCIYITVLSCLDKLLN